MSKPLNHTAAGDIASADLSNSESSLAPAATHTNADGDPGQATAAASDKLELTMFSDMGGYRIDRLLGQGAMGKVYLAQHTLLGRPAAIKVLHTEQADREAVERFFQEARAASAIDHPGIVKVYEVGENKEGSYLIMELLEGETLEERLLREHKLEVRDAVRFAVQIASALQAAHENGIVHRDLKPGNIFISPDPAVSGGERIKILDFGIAKMMVVGDGDPNVSQTRSDMLLGSPTYMSPEQCRGAQSVDGRADLYSLGCMLFEMLCGRPPFNQQVVAAVIAAHLREEPPAVTSLRPEVSPELAKTVLRLLAKDVDERYQSAKEFVDAIVQQGGHSLVVKTGVTHFFTTMVRERKRRPLALLALLVVIGVAVALFMVLRSDDSSAPEDDEVVAVAAPDFEPEELAAPPRPKLRVRMLTTSSGKQGGEMPEGGDGGDTLQLSDVEAMAWDQTQAIDEQTMISMLSGDLAIKLPAGTPLLLLSPDGKIMVPWFITSEPAGATVTFADGKPLAEGAVTPIFVEFEAVQRADTLIVKLDGYEPEEIPVKFHMPMRRQLTLVTMPEVTLTSEPAGAEVYETGAGGNGNSDGNMKVGVTPWTTPLSRKARRSISLRLPEYEDLDLELRGGMGFEEPLVMERLTEVTLKTRPRKVDVLENGVSIGSTPFRTRFSVKKGPPRTLTLSAGEKYDDQVVVLGPGQSPESLASLASVIELVPRVKLEVRTRKPAHATLLDSTSAEPLSTPHTYYVSRSAAPRTVVLSDDEYEDYSLEIGPEAKLPRKIEMVPLPRIEVVTQPKKAQVLDAAGNELGTTPLRLSFAKDKQALSLVIRKSGFLDQPLTVAYGEDAPRRIDLTPLETQVELASKPKDVEVFGADGQKLGQTPLLLGFKAGDPAMTLTLRKAGYADKVLSVSADQPPKKRIELERMTLITLESKPPGARVFDAAGTALGVTPLATTVARGKDKLAFKLVLAGYEPKTIAVVPSRDRKEKVSLAVEPTEITIEIISDPAGADVYLGSKKVGQTPYTVTGMSSSKRTKYTLRMKGYERKSLRVANDESQRIEIELRGCDQGDDTGMVTGIVNPYQCD